MVRRALVWLVIAFAIYSVIATPETAAAAVRGAGVFVQDIGGALLDFFDALTP